MAEAEYMESPYATYRAPSYMSVISPERSKYGYTSESNSPAVPRGAPSPPPLTVAPPPPLPPTNPPPAISPSHLRNNSTNVGSVPAKLRNRQSSSAGATQKRLRNRSNLELRVARISSTATLKLTDVLDHLKITASTSANGLKDEAPWQPVYGTHSNKSNDSGYAEHTTTGNGTVRGPAAANGTLRGPPASNGTVRGPPPTEEHMPSSPSTSSSGIYASANDLGLYGAYGDYWPLGVLEQGSQGKLRDVRYYWDDQAPVIEAHTAKGIDFLERYAAFLKERSAIEDEYASKLRSLVKKFQPRKKDEGKDDYQYSYGKAFLGVLNEVGDQAGQHELVAESLKNELCPDIVNKCRDLKEDRKMHLVEAQHLNQQLQYCYEHMNKAKKEYTKAFKEAQAAHSKFEKADANMDISRAELEKAKNNSLFRSQQCEDSKNAYALCTQNANKKQQQHYGATLPQVLENMRLMDEKRIAEFRVFVERSVDIEASRLPLIQKCLDEQKKHAGDVDALKDSQVVVEKYRTGYCPPTDLLFEDLGDPAGQASGSNSDLGSTGGGVEDLTRFTRPSKSRKSDRSATLGRVQSGRASKTLGERLFGGHKAVEFQEDYSDLPPSQRCQKLNKKIKQLQKEIDTKTQGREGILRMKQCYTDNPKLGDLGQVETQLAQFNNELDNLHNEMLKFQNYLREAESHMNMPVNAGLQVNTSNSSLPNGQQSKLSPARPPPPSGPTPEPPTSSRNSAASTSNSLQRGVVAPIERMSISDQDSISSDGSTPFSSITNPTSAGPTPSRAHINGKHMNGFGGSPESGIGHDTSRVSSSGGGAADNDELYNECADPMPVLGTARAMYAFDGSSEGTLSLRDQEELLLLEKDEGDGWTRVRRTSSPEEGFAPTSYLDLKWYPTS